MLALQSIGSAIADNIWILIPLTALMIPVFAIVLEPISKRMKANERREARIAYERLVMEKIDVLRTAVTMGYTKEDLKDLDARLERLVGSEKLKSILDVDKSVQKYEKALQVQDLATDQALEALQAAKSKITG